MNKFKKWLIPVVVVCLLLATLIGCSEAPQSLGQIYDPSGNPFANRFTDVKDIRTATFVVAASDSVHKYEADYFCNGTDDHVQIQAALDKLPDTGGEVFLLEGTYNVEVSVALDSYQTLIGCGRNTILITTTANLDIVTATGGSATEKVGITIADLCIDGNAGGVANDVGIKWAYVDHSIIKNVWSLNNGEEGIFLYNCDYNKIIGNTCQGNKDDNISVGQAVGSTIMGNLALESVVHDGIYVRAHSDYSTVIGNICKGNNDDGIEISESSNYVVTGNICQGSGNNGILLDRASNGIITDNVCTGNSQLADNAKANIALEGADYNNIQGNICRAPTVGTTLTTGEIAGATDIHVTAITGFEVGLGVVIDLGGANVEYHRISAIAAGIITIPAPGLTNAQGAGETIDVPEAQYGINISNDACDRNCLIGNDLYDSGKTGDLNDVPTTNPTLKHDNRNLAGTGWLAEV